jgi:predicted MPP superfamily phosphohydrolase
MRRPRFGLLLSLGVLVALLVSAHHYFAVRLVHDTALPAPWASIGDGAIALGAAAIFFHPLIQLRGGPVLGRILAWPTYLWLAACFYLLLGLGASDLGLFAAGLRGIDVARVRALSVLGATLALLAFGFWTATRGPALRRVEVAIDDWPRALDGYRIVQLSDLHFGSLIRRDFAEHLVERCAALAPDLIAVTGDLVDGSVEDLRREVEPLSRLRARDGVYFVTGNHDHYSGAESWVRRVRELGIEVLRNRRVSITRGDARFDLAGIDDYSSRRRSAVDGSDLREALNDKSDTAPVVLLAHDPRSFTRAREHDVALQISGHTHGGQMWPFGLFVRLQTEYVAGLYRRGRSQLYVSRGTGFWGPPVRLFARAEITELVLRSGQM